MKKLILCVAIMLISVNVFAQVGLGLRATPDGGGFTIKPSLSRYVALEGQLNAGGILTGYGRSFTAVLLAEFNIIFPDPSWRIFLGPGMHAGVWDRGWRYVNSENVYMDDNRGIFGMDAIFGVEYKFKKIPLGLSADIKPAINFLPEPEFFDHNMFGLAARVYLAQ